MQYLFALDHAHSAVWWISILGALGAFAAGTQAFRLWGKGSIKTHFYFAIALACSVFLVGPADWAVFGSAYIVMLPLTTWLVAACIGYVSRLFFEVIEDKSIAVVIFAVALVAIYFVFYAISKGMIKLG